MNLYYAVGGGLGHFSRAIAFVHSHPKLLPTNTIVMVADREMYTMRDHNFQDDLWSNLPMVKIPTQVFQDQQQLILWLQHWLSEHQPESIYLDTFPAGIAGEWNGLNPEGSRICYVGRYLQQESYSYADLISFDHAYQLEAWHPRQEERITRSCRKVIPFPLRYPAASVPQPIQKQINDWQSMGREVWAVVHSEPRDETEALLNHARDLAAMKQKNPIYLLCSSQPLEPESDMYPLRLFPAYGLFSRVDRIITACGFNLMQQALDFQARHEAVPFPRRYDNQFRRYKKWKAAFKS